MRSGRSYDQGSSQFRGEGRIGQQEGARSTFNPSTRGSFRTDPLGNRSSEGRNVLSDRSSDGQRGRFGNQGPRQYQAGRPSEVQVRNFLQLRGDDSQRQAGNVGERGEFRDGRSLQRDSDEGRRADVARRLGDSDRPGAIDDGRRSLGDRTRAERELSDNRRDGRRVGDLSRDRDRDIDRDQDFDRDRDLANRDRGDREGSREYQRWREGARGHDGNDDDHRDWSGKWRDGDRFDHARRIRDHWRDRDWDDDDDDFPFHGRWWDRDDHWHGHHGHHWDWWGHYAHRHHRPFYWWTWATVPRLTSWISFGWNRPYYWDYGPGEYIYCDDGIVYVNGRWYQPAPVFYERTVEIVERAPELTPEDAAQMEWLPLGVFAVTPDGAAQADVLVQLAVTKDGVISGTASDQKSGTAYPIEGMVDKQTQRAVWSYTNDRNKKIVMETSIYNLTQPEATGLVHYGPKDFRVVQLVRLEQPEAGAAPATSATGELPAP